ncbi:MAG TPA: NAD(P)H-hydrate dehydratase [Clostridia bacterium]|nr:NAD(P)H-hydrate dehydratase [Clostridia bacterium]
MKLLTAGEMRALDEKAISSFSIPGIILMENAGIRMVEAITEHLRGQIQGKRFLIFAGKGNNGGDGFVVARQLINKGAEVKVFLLHPANSLQGDAKTNYDILVKMGAKIYPVLQPRDFKRVEIALTYADYLIDAILGTGFKGTLQGLTADLVELLNKSSKPIFAIDIPSGLEADTGKANGSCIKATLTVTFGFPKIGLCMEKAKQYVGKLYLGHISFPPVLNEEAPGEKQIITAELVKDWLPKRDPDGHKGTFGHLLVVGGSEGMTGSVTLTATSALRTGAGMVTIGLPRSLRTILEAKTLEIMTKPLAETEEHTISTEALQSLLTLSKKMKAIVIGPGLSKNVSSIDLVLNYVRQIELPVVVDADGLAALAGQAEVVASLKAPLVLTPHPGEMARLMDISTTKVQADRLNVALACARKYQAYTVLKGSRTIVATPDGQIYINLRGNSGLATAGSGDVLAGVIGSFLAQGLSPSRACVCGVYLHSLAGDVAAENLDENSLIASDLISYFPQAFRNILANNDCNIQFQNLVRIY